MKCPIPNQNNPWCDQANEYNIEDHLRNHHTTDEMILWLMLEKMVENEVKRLNHEADKKIYRQIAEEYDKEHGVQP